MKEICLNNQPNQVSSPKPVISCDDDTEISRSCSFKSCFRNHCPRLVVSVNTPEQEVNDGHRTEENTQPAAVSPSSGKYGTNKSTK